VEQVSQPVDSLEIGPTTVINSLEAQAQIYSGGLYLGEWDGTTQNGQPAGNGSYFIKVDTVDPSGTVESVTQSVVVSRTLETFTVNIYNSAGEVVRHLLSTVTDPDGASLDQVQLSGEVLTPGSAGPSNQILITAGSAVSVVWDGRADTGAMAQNGTYYINLILADGGSQTEVTRSIVVLSNGASPIAGRVVASPNVIRPAGPPLTFSIQSAQVYILTAKLYDVAGELVRKFTHSSETNEVDGPTDGLASGVYIAVVTVEDTRGLFVGRQTLKVLVTH